MALSNNLLAHKRKHSERIALQRQSERSLQVTLYVGWDLIDPKTAANPEERGLGSDCSPHA